jgi:hypothetical protein
MPQYQGVWNLAQQAQAQINQQWVTDPLFDYTTLLLQGDNVSGSSQNNVFVDSSTNNFLITRNGNTTQGSFSPFSATGWSNYFSGSNDHFTTPSSAFFDLNTSTDWTIEGWFYPTSFSASNNVLLYCGSATNNKVVIATIGASGTLYYLLNGSTAIAGTLAPTLNAWNHIALVKSGTTTTLWLNGASLGTTTSAPTAGNKAFIFATDAGSAYYAGYMSNVRVAKGIAVYTSAFSPPTSPLGVTSGGQNPPSGSQTVLLSCQSNRFVDVTGNSVITVAGGTPSAQAFSPFAPQYQYTPTITGGSGYFDGTTDYLSIARNSVFFPAANTDFTFEAWIYPTATPGAQGAIIVGAGEYGLDSDWDLDINSSLQLAMYMNSSPATSYRNTTTTVRLNAWNHVAASRSGTGSNNLKVFVNGVGQSFTTNQTTVGTGTRNLTIGADQNGDEANYTGYISGLRLINGQGIYTADFTPPTAPPTTTSGGVTASNTVLLINFTNAGILDGTMKNDLETLGNAQVSTSIVKYGSGSMSFDGTGDYLQIQPNPAIANNFVFGTGDFTIEAWVYPNSLSAAQDICTYRKDSPATNSDIGFDIYVGASNASNEAAIYSSTTKYAVTGWSLVAGQWQHIAFVRSNGYLLFFVNGLQIGSPVAANVSVNNAATWYMIVGTYTAASRNFNGYIDDLRITKGIARYTRNFIPPQVALPRQ